MSKLENINRKKIDQYIKEERKYWKVRDDVLYKLCKKYPDHEREDEIIAKIIIIGRVYAAQVERGKGEISNDEFFKNKIPKKLKKVDSIIKGLSGINKITIENKTSLRKILKAHYNLSNIFKDIGNQSDSLASKYLHFHKPNLFFMYDRRAFTVCRHLCKDYLKKRSDYKDFINDISKVGCARTKYRDFIKRALILKDKIEKIREKKSSLRDFDDIMISIYNSFHPQKKWVRDVKLKI